MKKEHNEPHEVMGTAYDHAQLVLAMCTTKHGFFASGGKEGYNAVWARDSMITSLGASLHHEHKPVVRASIVTLATHQSKNGQIPNAVDKYSERKPHVDFQSIDSTLWYIIGQYLYKKRYNDPTLLKKYKHTIPHALNWLSCQDSSEKGLLVQQPTSDWMDAFPHKYGHVLNTHALYYRVLNLTGSKRDAEKMKKLLNTDTEWGLWGGSYYYPYRWKNHGAYLELDDWFDTLGNLLAIIFDLATPAYAEKILAYIKKKKIAEPYPIMNLYPPFTKKSKNWHDYFLDSDAGVAYNYANAGLWGFIGGFYVLALIKQKKFVEAEKQLNNLAKKSLAGNFPEWTHYKSKEAFGRLQAWDAGMYMLAYDSLKNKKVLL